LGADRQIARTLLAALVRLAGLGQRVDIDLWNYTAPSGASIRAALDYLLPFALGEKPWEGKQIKDFDPPLLYPVVRRAAAAFPDGGYAAAMKRFSPTHQTVAMDHFILKTAVERRLHR